MVHFPFFTRIIPFIFPFLFSACVSQQVSSDFDKQQAAKARVELALGYLQQRDYNQAKVNLDRALSYAPDDYLVHAARAYFYQQQSDVIQAEKAYLTAIKLDKKQGDVFNNFGTFLCAQGKYSAAYEQFHKALKAPNYYRQTDTYENLALCALSAKDLTVYQENLLMLEKMEPERAKKLALRAQ